MFQSMARNVLSTCLIIATLIATPAVMDAASIVVQNAGFEQPPVNPANGLAPAGTPVDNWYSPDYFGGGLWDINHFPYASWNQPAPEGNQVLYVGAFRGPNYYEQTLVDTVQANSIYDLTGFVGNPLGYPTNFTADLRAGSNVLASTTSAGPLGSFATFSVHFDSTASPYVGLPITIRLFSDGTQACFDDIHLNVSSIPEPSSIFLTIFGISVLIFGRKLRSVARWGKKESTHKPPMIARQASGEAPQPS